MNLVSELSFIANNLEDIIATRSESEHPQVLKLLHDLFSSFMLNARELGHTEASLGIHARQVEATGTLLAYTPRDGEIVGKNSVGVVLRWSEKDQDAYADEHDLRPKDLAYSLSTRERKTLNR